MFFRTLVEPRRSDLESVSPEFRWIRHHSRDGGWQFGEQGIIDTIASELGLSGFAVEIGAGDGQTLPLTLSRLAERGWLVEAYEADPESAESLKAAYPSVVVFGRAVTDGSVIDDKTTVAVIDIDGGELDILNSMGGRPVLIVVEHADVQAPADNQATEAQILDWAIANKYVRVARTRVNSVLVEASVAPSLARESWSVVEADRVWLGAGTAPEGWVHVTRPDFRLPLQIASGSASEVVIASSLSRMSPHGVYDLTREAYRILAPGGRLYVAEPSVEVAAAAIKGEVSAPAEALLYGYSCSDADVRRTGYDTNGLLMVLRSSGFFAARLWDGDIDGQTIIGDMFARVWCRKPSDAGDNAIRGEQVQGVLTAGRMVSTFTSGCLQQLARDLGIYTNKSVGVFYGQCMERMLTEYVKTHEWILTIDGDGVFTPDDVRELLAIAEQYPDGDAFAPLQARRGDGAILQNTGGQATVDTFAAEAFESQSAHFGLTLFRSSALRKMPHPWFLPIPNEDGEWGEGRVDDDMHFWRVFQEAGNKLYVCPFVHIGHIEEMVAWKTRDCLGTVHQYINDYCAHGKPREAR